MDPYAAAFIRSRSDLASLVATHSDAAWDATSPLTPQWRVRDVLGHLCGVSEDILAGNFPGADMDAWTSAQVARHYDVPLEEVVKKWFSSGIEENFSSAFSQMLFDQMSHEFDVRYALGAPGDQHSHGVRLGATWAVNLLRGEKAVTINLEEEVVELSGDEPSLTLTCTYFDLLRATTGRRSWDQVAALKWEGDVSYVRTQLFGSGFFTPALFDVEE